MNRLTQYTSWGKALPKDCSVNDDMIYSRLAEYEDSGLEPQKVKRIKAVLSDKSMRLRVADTAAYIMRLALKKACRRIPGRRFGKQYFIMQAIKQVANSNDIGEDEDS